MQEWQKICNESDLFPNAGIAALVGGEQVAVFYIPELTPSLYAIGNHDPIGKANVLSRGIVGDIQGEVVVASPLYKQHFSLTTGQCLEREDVSVPVWEARLDQGEVYVRPLVGEQPVLQDTGS
jgi:nitrite reductase (NADH) small subunit